MKTIRQIADEIGVSKTAVSKQIANLGLRSGLRKNGNQFAIDEHQEALIKQAFSEKSQTEIENQSQTKTQTENHEVGDLVCVLQATIDTLGGRVPGRSWLGAAGNRSGWQLRRTPAGARKSTFILTPKRGGGVKVLLRYFLTRK